MHLSRAAERRLKKKGKRVSKSESSNTNCCESSNGGHTLKFGSVAEIGYVVRSGVVFLVKCSAFAALGRMYVIRGSDYREVWRSFSHRTRGWPVDWTIEHVHSN